MSSTATLPAALQKEFLVVCLCAAWCGTCRDYQAGFEEMQVRFPEVGFIWVDIEDEGSGVEDWDVEDFPTLLIQRQDLVLFFGPMLPHRAILRQTLEVFLAQALDEAARYAHATPERATWQSARDYRETQNRNDQFRRLR